MGSYRGTSTCDLQEVGHQSLSNIARHSPGTEPQEPWEPREQREPWEPLEQREPSPLESQEPSSLESQTSGRLQAGFGTPQSPFGPRR
mmetsp:Transcript_93346/g.161782  ORF Transcript_93346/g.161782 Transcript_93346/m.161782 type:complete len:88 (+) Transcript_93346:129-392(+)